MKVISLDQYQPDPTIAHAMQFLLGRCDGANAQDNAGFNGVDAGEAHYLGSIIDEWTPAQEFKAWCMMRKYWRQLKKGDITLPKSLPEVLSAECLDNGDYAVTNHRNGKEYPIEMDGDCPIYCECDRFSFDSTCKHVEFVNTLNVAVATRQRIGIKEASQSLTIASTPAVAPSPFAALVGIGSSATAVIDAPAQTLTIECDESDRQHDIAFQNGFKPTNDQRMAFDRMMRFMHGEKWDDREFCLQGYAGTGKSTLLQAFVKVLLVTRMVRRVAFVAPTNKAAGVLQRMADAAGLSAVAASVGAVIDFYTCHKLLALRPVKGEKKEIDFEPDPKEENLFNLYDLVIVDECSMVGDSLYDFFMKSLNRFDCRARLLWVGDPAQLRPVKHNNLSLTFSCKNRVELREVVRYSGPIGQVATDIRNGTIPTIETALNDSKGTIVFANRREWEASIVKAFQSPRYADNYDYARAIAFTNKRVQYLNAMVRDALYPGAPEFVTGERVMAQESYAPDSVTLLENSTEYTIAEAREGRSGKWDVWYLTLLSDTGVRVVAPVIKRESQRLYDEYLQALANTKRWFEYWKCRESYAVVRYPYALTAHKSQGSTFANTFLDWPDLTQQRKGQQEGDRMSLIYTAWTRASDRVCVY